MVDARKQLDKAKDKLQLVIARSGGQVRNYLGTQQQPDDSAGIPHANFSFVFKL